VALNYIVKRQDVTEDWHITPPAGVQVPFPNSKSVLVLRKHETRRALVAVTVLVKN
jgi:hypothetical protein